jgi:hypothetical protein
MKIVIPLLLVTSLLAPAKERKSKLNPAAQAGGKMSSTFHQ